MTDNDREFVKLILKHRRLCPNTNRLSLPVEEMDRLLTLLYESEAMRKKAEFYLRHPRAHNNEDFCLGCNSQQKSHWEDEHFWSDADWLAAVRKEIEGE